MTRIRLLGVATAVVLAAALLPASAAHAQSPASAVSVDDVVKAEGDSGTTAFVFTVSLNTPSSQDVTVHYEALDGDATGTPGYPGYPGGPATTPADYPSAAPAKAADGDYAPASGLVTIPAGSTVATVTVNVTGDGRAEPDERFLLALSNPTGATLGHDTGAGIITNDDTFPVIAQPADVTVTEGNSGSTDATFTVALSHTYPEAVTVRARTVDGSASAGSDYTAQDSRITIPADTLSTTVSVPVTGDTAVEPDETFGLELSAPAKATLAGGAATLTATGTIKNDDTASGGGAAAPVITVDSPRVLEGASGLKALTFTLIASPAPTTSIAVNFATQYGTATPGVDYVAQSGTVTFAPGQTSKQVVVAVVGDTVAEADETLGLVLSAPTAPATLGSPPFGVGTIVNDDVKVTGSCKVPKVKGVTLATAKERIKAAGCKVAPTTRRHSRTVRRSRAIGTSVSAGKVVPAGTKVAVIVSTGKPPAKKKPAA
jgi:hypothetical protein